MKKQIMTIIGMILLVLALVQAQNLGFEEGMSSWTSTYTSTGQDYTSIASNNWSTEGTSSLHFGGTADQFFGTPEHSATINHTTKNVLLGDIVCVDVQTDKTGTVSLFSRTAGSFFSSITAGETRDICITSTGVGKLDLNIQGTLSAGCQGGICLTRFYLDNIRITSCFDSVKNQNESDVDCGGPYCDACQVNETCVVSSDCVTGICSSGICATNETSGNESGGSNETVDVPASESSSGSGSGGGSGRSAIINDLISIRGEDYTSKEQVQASINQLHQLYSGTLTTGQRLIYEQKLAALQALLQTYDEAVEIETEEEIEEENTEMDQLRTEFGLEDETTLDEETVVMLRNLKNINPNHYENVVEIVRDADENQKEVLIEEVSVMDPTFTEELLSSDNREEQLENYVYSVKRGVQSTESIINENIVQEIFNGNTDLEDILDFLNSPPRFTIESGSEG